MFMILQLTTSKKNFQIYDWIQEIRGWKEKFEDVKFRRIPREDNKAADSLAKQFQDSSKFCNSFYYVSLSITYILIHEDHYWLSYIIKQSNL